LGLSLFGVLGAVRFIDLFLGLLILAAAGLGARPPMGPAMPN